jgi:hypothetical protein
VLLYFSAPPVEPVQNRLPNDRRATPQQGASSNHIAEAINMEQEGAEQPQQHVPPPPQMYEAASTVLTSSIRTRLKWQPISMRLKGSTCGTSKEIHPF